jgi:glycosyltransferase involved in cell wall biosynthesis
MATCMQKQGHEVAVVTFAFRENLINPKRSGNVLAERYMYNGIPVISFGYEKLTDDVHYRVHNEGLERFAAELFSEERPDIIHAGHLMRVFDLLRVARKRSIPYIVTLTDFWSICFRGILVDSNLELCTGPKKGEACLTNCAHLAKDVIQVRLKETTEVLMGASLVCSPTKFLADIYMNEIPGLEIKVIPLGLKIGKAVPERRDSEKGRPVTLIFGGTWLPHKGLHVLLEAFKDIENQNIVLKIYGTGPNKEYKDKIDESGRKDNRIQIKGIFSEDDIDAIFKDADATIIPSIWWENSPYMLTEALARNVPAIVTDVDGLTEFVKEGVNGLTFRLGDSRELQKVIERVAGNPEALQTLRGNLSRYVLQTVEEEAYAYEKCLLQAIP